MPSNTPLCAYISKLRFHEIGLNSSQVRSFLLVSKINGLNETFLDKTFVGGTIFWVRYNIIKKYFTDNVVQQLMNNTKPGYVIEPSSMHAIERIFGYVVSKENQNVMTPD